MASFKGSVLTPDDHDEIVRNHADWLINVILSLGYFRGIRRSDAEDASQNILMNLWKCFSRNPLPQNLQETGGMKAYLYKAAQNCVIDWIRQKNRIFISIHDDDDDGGLLLVDGSPTPDEKMLSTELAEILISEIRGLEKDERQVIILRRLDGLTLHATSSIMERPISQIRTLEKRGLKKLQKSVKLREYLLPD